MRFIVLGSVGVALTLAMGIVLASYRHARLAENRSQQIESPSSGPIIKALQALHQVSPSPLSLGELAAAADASPGTIALGLAGNPSVEWQLGRDGYTRYYSLRDIH